MKNAIQELIIIPPDHPELCADFDDDCFEVSADGKALACYLYDPKRGKCPFVGD